MQDKIWHGNLAKAWILDDLSREHVSKVLDVGCGDMSMWAPLKKSFDLFGVDTDVEAIAKAKSYGAKALVADAFKLSEIFPKNTFDAVVSTQVLEHIKNREKFILQLKHVTKPRGLIYLSFDSAYPKESKIKHLKLLATRFLRGYFEKPLSCEEIEPIFTKLSLEIVERRFYNIQELKRLHNHKLPKEKKNEFLWIWKTLEDYLNESGVASTCREFFRGIAYKLRR